MLGSVLSPYVASFVPYDVNSEPGIHRGLPSTALTFVLPVGEPLEVSWAADPDSRRVGWSCVSGLHTGPAHIHHGRRQRGVQLGLTALGVRALLGLPLGALADELLTLDDLDGLSPTLRHLPEQLADLPTQRDRARLVTRRLVEALASAGAPGPRAEVGHALSRLTGGVSVAHVADETGLSRRHLGSLVRAECGVTPKQLQRIARFERSHDRLRRTGASTGLAALAVECGYADQAHLSREWAALARCSPTTWLREEFPIVQDTGGPERETDSSRPEEET